MISDRVVRRFCLTLALLTVSAGVWRTAVAFALEAQSTGWAARLGEVRGDLWSTDALKLGRYDPQSPFSRASAPAKADETAYAVERALGLSPTRSDVWLLLSTLTSSSPGAKRDGALQMAYLVGAGKTEELAGRLAAAARSPALSDETLQAFVSTDIAIALSRPALSDVVRKAYAAATPSNKTIFAGLVRRIDPTAADRMLSAP